MIGNFIFENTTKLIFGEDSLKKLGDEIDKYGERVLFVYGLSSIKKSGLYDEVISILKEHHKTIFEDSGVMPNPTIEKLNEGIKIARDNKINFILAVGGGSVIDYSKALSVSINTNEDPWEYFFIKGENPKDDAIVPMGCVLTMSGTGSEMNATSVITNYSTNQKITRMFKENVNPRFSILNPKLLMSISYYQMVSGIYDSFNHLMEQYFSGENDNANDYMMEGMMRSIIHSSLIAINNPNDYEARSNLMWDATLALNTMFRKGKEKGDWKVHRIGHGICVATNASHGMTLSSITNAYYRFMIPYGIHQFKRFAINVWGVTPSNKSDEQIANEGIDCLINWMNKLKVEMKISNFGIDRNKAIEIAHSVLFAKGGYKDLNEEEIREILINSL